MISWEESSKSIGFKVNKLNGILRSGFKEKLNSAGWKITPEQWGTIHFLKYNSGCTQIYLAKASKRDQTSITRLVDGLQRKGLVERKNDKSDRRAYRLYLTEYASNMYTSTFSYVKEFNDNLKNSLTESEGLKLVELMDKLYNSLETGKTDKLD